MRNCFRIILFGFTICLIIFANSLGQDADSPSDEKSADKTAEKADDKNSEKKDDKAVSLTGVFEAKNSMEIILKPQEWKTFTVKEIVEHGQDVQKGDVLVSFEVDKYEKAVDAAETALKTSKLGLEDAKLQLQSAKQTSSITIKAAKDADQKATDDLKDWVTRGKARQNKSADRSLKSAKDRLDYQMEELKQLEKMYKADDLTEDTEEIILKRTRDAVDSAKYSLELSEEFHRRAKEVTIPRTEDGLETAVKQAAIALTEAIESTPRKLKQQEIKLAQQELAVEEESKKLKRLQSDKKFLKVNSPRDGIVYYGGSTRGKWPALSTLAASLKVGGSAKTDFPILTIVDPNSLTLRVTVSETSLRHVSKGTKCEITSAAFPDAKLDGKVSQVSRIPISEGNFDGVIDVQLQSLQGKLLPGMKGTAKITIDKKDND